MLVLLNCFWDKKVFLPGMPERSQEIRIENIPILRDEKSYLASTMLTAKPGYYLSISFFILLSTQNRDA